MDAPEPITVIETPSFIRDSKNLLGDDERRRIMSGRRIIESMQEAVAISRRRLQRTYI
jgi:hypothetical protein